MDLDKWKTLLETTFWTDLSDDEGIGSDESLEQVSTSSPEGELKKKEKEVAFPAAKPRAEDNKIKRSRSLLVINQLRAKLIGPISGRFQDNTESVSSGVSRIDVFGLPLTEVCIKTGSKLPEIVTFCIDHIEKIGITIDGIYRISGQAAIVESMKNLFEQRKVPATITEKEIHSLASVLKLFFRSLPDPLLTYNLYDRLMEISRLPVHQHGQLMREAVRHLPYHHLETLSHLVGHLHYLAQHLTTTGMTARNLAIVWAPNLIRHPSRDTNWADCGQQAGVIESLIVNYSQVFSQEMSTVNEVSIDEAIEEVESKAIKRTTSYCDIDTKSIRLVDFDTSLKRCKSESKNISLEGSRENQRIDLSGWFQSEARDEDSFSSRLCDRHRAMLERSEDKKEYESLTRTLNKKLIKNIGKLRSSKSRLRGVLSRVTSFRTRNGNYQVNAEAESQPSESNNSVAGEERWGYHYFQDVERVLKQFEFLEDQYDTTRVRQKGKNADVGVGSSVKHTVRQDISHHEETLNNLEALQKLQNSVKEVNQLFTEESLADAELNAVSSGIFYAEVVMAR